MYVHTRMRARVKPCLAYAIEKTG